MARIVGFRAACAGFIEITLAGAGRAPPVPLLGVIDLDGGSLIQPLSTPRLDAHPLSRGFLCIAVLGRPSAALAVVGPLHRTAESVERSNGVLRCLK